MSVNMKISGSMQNVASVDVKGLGKLTNSELEDFVSSLWENIDELPSNIQALMYASQEETPAGMSAFLLVAGWAIGRINYVHGDLWKRTRPSWIANTDIN